MNVIVTDEALKSLELALTYYIDTLDSSPSAITKIKTALFSKASLLSTSPLLGQIEPNLKHLNKNHRRLISRNFKIIYRVECSTVYVTDFFDARQAPQKMKGV